MLGGVIGAHAYDTETPSMNHDWAGTCYHACIQDIYNVYLKNKYKYDESKAYN
jgi:hypothetical protein